MITAKIKQILIDSGCTLVIYEQDKLANLYTDQSDQFDIVGVIMQPNEITLEVKANAILEHYNPLTIDIISQVRLEDKADNNEVRLQQLLDICKDIIVRLIYDSQLNPLEGFKFKPLTVTKVLETKYDANVIGWTMPLDLIRFKNENKDFCIPPVLPIALVAPTLFSATVFSNTQINLTWTSIYAVAIERSLNGNDFAEIHRTLPGVAIYSNTGLTAGTRYYYRARAFSGTNYSAYTNVEDAIPLYTMLLTSTGNGISTLRMQVSSNITVTLGTNATFYTDAAGTLNPGATWTITVGAVRTIYLKCTTGTALMTFSDILKVTKWGDNTGVDGWVSGTNAASITAVLPSIVNLTQVKINGNAYLSGSLPAGVTFISLWPLVTWSYNGNPPVGVTFLYMNGVNLDWTVLDFTGSGNITYFNLNNYRIAKMSSADMITLLTSLTNRVGTLPATITINDYLDYAAPPIGVTNAVATLKATKSVVTVNLGA